MTLSLFVYGSLRPGKNNYEQLQEAVLGSQTVLWPGHLRLRPEGYPALTLPQEWPMKRAKPYDWSNPASPPPATPCCDQRVLGEILLLRDGSEIRQRLDDFEGFTPELNDYVRVACSWQGQWVWTYVAPEDRAEWPIISQWPHQSGEIPPWR